MRFKLQIDGVGREVAAGPAGDVSVDGTGLAAKVTAPSADRRTVEINGKSYEIRVIEAATDTGEFLLEVAGERITVKAGDVVKDTAPVEQAAVAPAAPQAARPPEGPKAAGALEEPVPTPAEEVRHGVWAPMPGKIVRVLVRAGQEVKEGDPVVLLEAMKMENELRSPATGTVGSVHVAEGDQAERGQLLIAFA
jgi:biotin carboxyl carrier protein